MTLMRPDVLGGRGADVVIEVGDAELFEKVGHVEGYTDRRACPRKWYRSTADPRYSLRNSASARRAILFAVGSRPGIWMNSSSS
jgi:hypothetical protein